MGSPNDKIEPTHEVTLANEKDSSSQKSRDEKVETEVLRGSVGLEAAKRSHPPKPFGKHMIKLYSFVVVAFLCSALNGFDGSLIGALLPMPEFKKTFGTELVGSKASLIAGMYTIGGVSALPLVGPCLDTLGRRFGMFIGCLSVVVGTIIGGTANSRGPFLASRFFLGLGYSLAASAAPAYVVEISHPAYRDVLTGLYNCQYYVGAITAAGACRASLNYSSSLAWRLPVWCQMICSSIVVLFVWFLPESPRWLYSHGRKEEAWKLITELHGEGDENNAFVQLQIREYEEIISLEGSDKRFWDYSELFNSRASRWRLICVFIPSVFGQWSGNAVLSYYIGGLLQTAGVTNPTQVLNINLGNTILSASGAYLGAAFTPKWRRRPMLIGVCLACALLMAGFSITTGLYNHDKSQSAATACVVLIFVYGFCYSVGWTPLQALYPVECLSYEIRAKGMAFSSVMVNIACLVNQFGIGNCMSAIGWHTYLIFVGWDVIQAIVVYFFAVETNNRTLEELSEIFEAPNPRKASTKKQTIIVSKTNNQIVGAEENISA